MYAQYWIIGNCINTSFLSFLLSAYLIKKLFPNNLKNFFCLNAMYKIS